MGETFKVAGTILEVKQDELEIHSIKNFKDGDLLAGHLMHKVGNRMFMLISAGGYIDQGFLNHYIGKGMDCVYIDTICHEGIVNVGKQLLSEFINAGTHEDKVNTRKKFLGWFKRNFWDEEIEVSILDLVITVHAAFFKLPGDVCKNLLDTSVVIYNRSMLVASLSVVVGMMMGHYEYEVLTDIYHSSILLDYGLLGSEFNYHIMKACELEHTKPGEGISYLEKNATKDDLDFFLYHPNIGAQQARMDCEPIAAIGNIYSVIEKHHELIEGRGFPAGLKMGELAEIEQISIFLDHLIPFDLDRYKVDDGVGFFAKLVKQAPSRERYKLIPCKKVVNTVMSYFDMYDEQYEEAA